MNGVSGGGSESESCSRCHDEGNMIDSNGVAHPTTAPHDGSHTSCTLYSLGPRGGILDIYFEPSHISSATIYPIYYNGWEGYLGHNGWKLFYTTDTAQKRNAEFNPGEEHAAGELEGDTYGNGGFEGWTECFAQFPRFDDGGALMSTTNNNARWGVTANKPSISVDCVGSDAVGIRLWQNNVGSDNVGQMFMYELDVFGRHIRTPSPPAPPPLPPTPPPYPPDNAPMPPPFAPTLGVTGCFMDGAGTGGRNWAQCSNCHDGVRTNNCIHTTGSNGGILDIYFEPSIVSNVVVHLLNNGLLQQGGWKVFYTTNPEARYKDNFQGVTTNAGTMAPSLTAHEGFGEDWQVCYEDFPDLDYSGIPWTSPLFKYSEIRNAYLVTIKCESAVGAVGIRVWQMSTQAYQMKIGEVDVHGQIVSPPLPPPLPPNPPNPPAPPPLPPFSWPDEFGEAPDDGICSKHFDYVLIMQWSVGSMPNYAGRDGLAGASNKEDIMAVAGAWISSFEHGVGLARGGILMLYNGGTVWATEFPQTEVRDVLTEFDSWLDANEKKEQPTGSEIAAALEIVDDKFTDGGDLSKATQQVVYSFFFDYNGLDATHSNFMAMKSKYHVYIMSLGGMLPSAYLWPHWMDVYGRGDNICYSNPCLSGYTENVADKVKVHATEECFGTPTPCARGNPSVACAAPPPPSPSPPPNPPAPPPSPPALPAPPAPPPILHEPQNAKYYPVAFNRRCSYYTGGGGDTIGMHEYMWPSRSHYQQCCDSNGNSISGSQTFEQLRANCEKACDEHTGAYGQCNMIAYGSGEPPVYCNLGTYGGDPGWDVATSHMEDPCLYAADHDIYLVNPFSCRLYGATLDSPCSGHTNPDLFCQTTDATKTGCGNARCDESGTGYCYQS